MINKSMKLILNLHFIIPVCVSMCVRARVFVVCTYIHFLKHTQFLSYSWPVGRGSQRFTCCHCGREQMGLPTQLLPDMGQHGFLGSGSRSPGG